MDTLCIPEGRDPKVTGTTYLHKTESSVMWNIKLINIFQE